MAIPRNKDLGAVLIFSIWHEHQCSTGTIGFVCDQISKCVTVESTKDLKEFFIRMYGEESRINPRNCNLSVLSLNERSEIFKLHTINKRSDIEVLNCDFIPHQVKRFRLVDVIRFLRIKFHEIKNCIEAMFNILSIQDRKLLEFLIKKKDQSICTSYVGDIFSMFFRTIYCGVLRCDIHSYEMILREKMREVRNYKDFINVIISFSRSLC